MDLVVTSVPFAIAMFVGMLICLEIGRRAGRRRLARDPEGLKSHGSIDGAVFALYGLLIAFTFSGAPARLDRRRQLIAEEANAVSTAYLRLDLLNQDEQPALRDLFRQYLDSRIQTYRLAPDVNAMQTELARSIQIQKAIWRQAIVSTRKGDSHPEAGKLLLPAINDMIDITTTRTMATKIHPPTIVFGLLFLLALVVSILAGYGTSVNKQRSWLHIVAFVVIAVISVYVALEIEYPRLGLIPMASYDQMLVDVRTGMQ